MASIHGKHYVDPGELAGLLRTNAGNRKRRLIWELLDRIAQRIATNYFYLPHQLVEDAASEASLYAVRLLPRYRRRNHPFWYFSTVIENEMKRQIKMNLRLRAGYSPCGRDEMSHEFQHAGDFQRQCRA